MDVIFDADSTREPGWRVQLVLSTQSLELDDDGDDDDDLTFDSSDRDGWFVSGLPVFWRQAPGCEHDHGCACEPVDVDDALDEVEDRDGALAAYLDALVQLQAHADTAANIADGSERSPVCVACVLHPEQHALALEEKVMDAAVPLVRVASRWGLRTNPQPSTLNLGPSLDLQLRLSVERRGGGAEDAAKG